MGRLNLLALSTPISSTTVSIAASPATSAPPSPTSRERDHSPLHVFSQNLISSLQAISQPEKSMGTSSSFRNLLNLAKQNESFQTLFHLPADETVIEEVLCSLWFTSSGAYLRGKMYLSAHFICFQSSPCQV